MCGKNDFESKLILKNLHKTVRKIERFHLKNHLKWSKETEKRNNVSPYLPKDFKKKYLPYLNLLEQVLLDFSTESRKSPTFFDFLCVIIFLFLFLFLFFNLFLFLFYFLFFLKFYFIFIFILF